MGAVEWLLIAALATYCCVGLARFNNRADRRARKALQAKGKAKGGETQAAVSTSRPSLLVSAWNASGAQKVQSDRLVPALAELVGRGLGATVRKRKDKAAQRTDTDSNASAATRDAAVKLGQKLTAAARIRWEQRGERAPLLWKRTIKPGVPVAGPAGQDDGDQPLPAFTECPKCEAGVAATIPASEYDVWTTCSCGFRIGFYRQPNDPPDETTTTEDPAGTSSQDATTEGTTMTVPTQRIASSDASSDDEQLQALAPADWSGLAQRIADFHPESDADLINLMTGEVAGICAYSEGYEALHEHCVRNLGLDPTAVQGLGEFSDHVMELTQRMAAAHQQFLATYQEVMAAVANGVVLPYNGRFITGGV